MDIPLYLRPVVLSHKAGESGFRKGGRGSVHWKSIMRPGSLRPQLHGMGPDFFAAAACVVSVSLCCHCGFGLPKFESISCMTWKPPCTLIEFVLRPWGRKSRRLVERRHELVTQACQSSSGEDNHGPASSAPVLSPARSCYVTTRGNCDTEYFITRRLASVLGSLGVGSLIF